MLNAMIASGRAAEDGHVAGQVERLDLLGLAQPFDGGRDILDLGRVDVRHQAVVDGEGGEP